MSTLRFSDGIEINMSGDHPTLELHDGWYVVGHGCLSPCADEEEAKRLCEELRRTSKDPSAS
jgi:hypothetical protein